MALIFSTATLVEKNRLESPDAWIWLFQVDIAGAGGPLNYAMFHEPITFHGQTFAPTGVEIDAIEDGTHASLVHVQARFQNVDQVFMALFETYWVTIATPVWMVRQWQVSVRFPDELPFERANVYSVAQAQTDTKDAVVELVLEGLTLTALIPKNRYISTNGFPHMPKSR